MKLARWLLLFIVITVSSITAQPKKPKILHLSFHSGCINDLNEVARALDLDIEPFFILESDATRDAFDGMPSGNQIYNITAERAARIWSLHKGYFNSFDAIITSDTALLSRIFLQYDWHKPLIIWVCDRFDYADMPTAPKNFPDKSYYQLMRSALGKSNVKVIPNTPYEYLWARGKDVWMADYVIKPMGSIPRNKESLISAVPATVNKADTVFVFPRLSQQQSAFVIDQCNRVGVKTYTGSYNGSDDLTDFKGVLYFPYQWSTLTFFDHIQRGIVHFVPTLRFVTELLRARSPVRFVSLEPSAPEWIEWYNSTNNPYIVYFDSWEDLKNKVAVDYTELRKRIIAFARDHRQTTLQRWQKVFNDLALIP